MCHKLDTKTFTYATTNQVSQLVVCSFSVLQKLADKAPATWSRKATACTFGIMIKKVLFGKCNVAHNILVNVVVNSPSFPAGKVNTHFQMHKTVGQRAGHTVSNTFVAFAIAGSY